VAALAARPDFEYILRGLREYGVVSPGDERLSALRFFRSTGCADCRQTGYRGRLGIFELFPVNDHVRPLIMARRESSAIREAAVAHGMRTLLVDGLAKAIMGETSLDEVMRASV
jgi:type II secretory ATPase GspE/PulE/Tfp pilus assembly ATPase PilB-like protein